MIRAYSDKFVSFFKSMFSEKNVSKFPPNCVILDNGKEKKVYIEPSGEVYNMWEHIGWGDTIRFMDYSMLSITGHYSLAGLIIRGPRPSRLQVGDELRCKMKSGVIGRFIISDISYEGDPEDLFFGHVGYLGVLEDKKENT